MGKLLERLQDASRSGVYRARRSDEIVDAVRNSAIRLFRIDGFADKEGLLAGISRALDFPEWFGGNWDALEDCLTDLSWCEAPGYVLLFQQHESLAKDDFGVLIDILASAAEYWAGRGKPFFAVFVDPGRKLGLPGLFREA